MSNLGKKTKQNQALLMLTIDGWGLGQASAANIFTAERAPNLSALLESYPCTKLATKAALFGYAASDITTKEVGHLALALGAPLAKASGSAQARIDDGSFFKDHNLLAAVSHSKEYNSNWHLFVASEILLLEEGFKDLSAILELAKRKKIKQVYLHLVLSNDAASAISSLKKIESLLEKNNNFKIASLIGADYVLNNNYDWDKTEALYKHLTDASSATVSDPLKFIQEAASAEQDLALMKPRACLLDSKLKNGDVVFFFKQEESMFQIASALTESDFDKFERVRLVDLLCLSFAQLPPDLAIKTINTGHTQVALSAVLSKHKLKQLVITESAGAIAACYYGNALLDHKLVNQEWLIINSPLASMWQQEASLATEEIVKEAIRAINSANYDFISVNISALDLIGQLGNEKLMIDCLEQIDRLVANLIKVSLDKDCLMFVTSACSRSEAVVDLAGREDKFLNTNHEVPFIVVGNNLEGRNLGRLDLGASDFGAKEIEATLLDVAPTILQHFNLEKPKSMTGESLL